MIPHELLQPNVASWMPILRDHDIGLYRHSLRVADLTALFSSYLGFSSADQMRLIQAALLHDIGKVEIPLELLCKPTALTASEIENIRLHPEAGYRMLLAQGGHGPELLSVVRQHHERLDGSGYPHGILSSAISDPVRIVTLCDIYAAMTEPRPYATPFSQEDAIRVMEAKRTRLDRELMRHFASMMENFVYVYREEA